MHDFALKRSLIDIYAGMPATKEVNTLAVVGPYVFINIAVKIVFMNQIMLFPCIYFHDTKTVEITFISVMFHALPADILTVRREFRIDIIAYLHVAILMVHLLPFHCFGGINFRFLIAFRLTEIGSFSRCQTVEIDVCIRGNGILCAFFLSAGIGDALRVCAPGNLSDPPERCHGRLIGFTLHNVFSFIDAICGYIGHERVGNSFHVMIPMPIVHVCNP